MHRARASQLDKGEQSPLVQRSTSLYDRDRTTYTTLPTPMSEGAPKEMHDRPIHNPSPEDSFAILTDLRQFLSSAASQLCIDSCKTPGASPNYPFLGVRYPSSDPSIMEPQGTCHLGDPVLMTRQSIEAYGRTDHEQKRAHQSETHQHALTLPPCICVNLRSVPLGRS